MTAVARPLTDATRAADVLIVPLACHACDGPLREVDQGNGGTRRTWTGRCTSCGVQTVLVVDAITIHPGGRSYEA